VTLAPPHQVTAPPLTLGIRKKKNIHILKKQISEVGMHRILILPDIQLIKKTGYQISSRILGLTNIFFC
jgi:hypothetical protein